MSKLEVKGTIKQIGELQTFESGFQKVEFVLTTDEQYPQDIKFECLKEKADNLLKFNKVGDYVDVSFNLRGNEYNNKYYVNLVAWKVFKAEAEGPMPDPVPAADTYDGGDDLPF